MKNLFKDFEIDLNDICPACESKQKKLFLSDVKDYVFESSEDNWSFNHCLDCDSIYMHKRLKKSYINKAYHQYYTHSKNQPNPIKNFLSNILTMLNHNFLSDIDRKSAGKILDIGCGNGDLLNKLKDPNWEKTGIEIDENARKEAYNNKIQVIEGGYRVLEDIDEKFDVIIVSHVLEHVYDPKNLIRLAIKALNKDGEIWFQWPNPESELLKVYKHFWRGLEAPRHICLMSKKSFTNIINSQLFKGKVILKDCSDRYPKSLIYMNLSSQSIKKGDKGYFSKSQQILEYIKFYLMRTKTKNSEFCTFVVKKI